jgi:penicillin-binding protein 2
MNDPKIAIAVVVENAGFGASWAAPIAALMMEQYLNDSIAGNRKYLYDRMVKADLIHAPGSDSKKDSTHQKPNKDAVKVTDD